MTRMMHADETIAKIIEPSFLDSDEDTFTSIRTPPDWIDSQEQLLKRELKNSKQDKQRWERNIRNATRKFNSSVVSSEASLSGDSDDTISFVREVQNTVKKELQADALLAATLSGNTEEEALHRTGRTTQKAKAPKAKFTQGHAGHVSNQLQLLGFPPLPEDASPAMLNLIAQLTAEVNRRGDVIETLLQKPAPSVPLCELPREASKEEEKLHDEIVKLQMRLDGTLRELANVQRGSTIDTRAMELAEDHQLVMDVCHMLGVSPESRKSGLIQALVPLLPSLRVPVDADIVFQHLKTHLNLPSDASASIIVGRLDGVLQRLTELELGLDDMRNALFSSADVSMNQVMKRATKICRAWKTKHDSRRSSPASNSLGSIVACQSSVIDVVGLSPNTVRREQQQRKERVDDDDFNEKREMLRRALMELEEDISSVPTNSFGTRSTSMDKFDRFDDTIDRSVALRRLEQMLRDEGGSELDVFQLEATSDSEPDS